MTDLVFLNDPTWPIQHIEGERYSGLCGAVTTQPGFEPSRTPSGAGGKPVCATCLQETGLLANSAAGGYVRRIARGPILLGLGLVLMVIGIVTGIVWSQNRCYNRYLRLCHRWFSGDPEGELGCLERADDVCYH